MTEVASRAPPPWQLAGHGFVVAYRRPPDALLERWLDPSLRDRYLGGPAALMAVAYERSDVGPYDELLFIPGRFRYGTGIWPTITRILVSTAASVVNGRRNWSIPKEQASFSRARDGAQERWRIADARETVAELTFRAVGPSLPVTTRLLPGRWSSVAQARGEELLVTRLTASGRWRFARLVDARFAPALFPDLASQRPRLAVAVQRFRMTFAMPRRVPLSRAGTLGGDGISP